VSEQWPNTVSVGPFLADKDAPGDIRLTTKVEGWGSPARRMVSTPRTGANGSYLLGQYWGDRTIVHTGLVMCGSASAAAAVAGELAALAPGIFLDYVIDNDATGAVACRVQVAVGAEPEWIDASSFTYALTLAAPDPFKRALTATTVPVTAGATVSHTAAGTFPAEIEVTLTSGGTVDLTIAGLRLRTASLPSGAILTSGPGFIRPKRTIRSALPANANLFGSIVQPMQWPAMVPGANSIHQAGTAGLSIRYFPTYA